jgi:hypothetical protein
MSGPITHPSEAISRTKEAADLRMNIRDVMTNPQNPLHEGYVRGDPDVLAAIQREYEKIYGKGQTVLDGEGIVVNVTLDGKK